MNTRYCNFSDDVIRLAILLYVRYPLSLRQVEELLAERGIEVSYETIRRWWGKFGPVLAKEIKAKRAKNGAVSNWRWHIDEVFVRVNGEIRYLWRALDHEGEVIDAVVTKRRDGRTAKKLLRKLIKRQGCPEEIVTDGLRAYGAAFRNLDFKHLHMTGQWKNNRVENSHQPFRRQERSMQKFRRASSLQRFVSIHSQVHNHFNVQRHLVSSHEYRVRRDRAMMEWQASRA